MNAAEWGLLVAFAATIWGISFISPDAAVMLGGFAALVLLVDSGLLGSLSRTFGGKTQ